MGAPAPAGRARAPRHARSRILRELAAPSRAPRASRASSYERRCCLHVLWWPEVKLSISVLGMCVLALRRRARRHGSLLGLVLVLVPLLSSCAYYNTFYLARRYHERGNNGQPYPVEKPDPAAVQNLNKSIEYSKKLIASYPKSKWVDDAYLLWAKALLGKDDPIQTVNMLRDFPARYPNSPLKNEALFYWGVANRHARRYSDAVSGFEEFLRREPKHELAPYANLELARSLMALKRPGEAAAAAGVVIDRYPKSKLRYQATMTRAEALVAVGEFEEAR